MASKKIETMTGIFVVGFFMILIAIVILYTVRGTLETRQTYVLYFSGSLNGIKIGSPVKFRGIRVGEVIDIKFDTDPKTLKINIPIYIHFIEGRGSYKRTAKIVKALIRKGLRAELISANILTGTQVISLVIKPNTPIHYHQVDDKYIEIPTISSDIRDAEFGKTMKSADELLKSINKIVSSPAAQELIPNVNKTLVSTNQLLKETHQIAIKANKKMDPISNDINKMLIEIKEMATSIRTVTEYLSRHPESIIIGKTRR